MNYAMILLDENYDFALNSLNKIKSKNAYAIAFILGNYELNGLPFSESKISRTEKLLEIGFDLVIEIPSIIYLKSIDLFKKYLFKLLIELKVELLFLPSENNSFSSFKNFHSTCSFYYPSFDKLFHFYLNSFSYEDSVSKAKEYISQFYKMRIYDYFNLNIINDLRKNHIKFRLIKSKFCIKPNPERYQRYFSYFKLNFTFLPSDIILNELYIDYNTFNMIKNKLYKLETFDELVKLSAPKNFQFSSFFRSILLTLIFCNMSFETELDNTFIKCLGFNKKGSNILRVYKNNMSENSPKILTKINPSNSLIEKYQMSLELFYSYLFLNKYNSNNDLFKFPIKYDKK